MKRTLFTALILLWFGSAGFAQQHFSADLFKQNLGKSGTLCDTVYSLRVFSDTLALLNMGGAYPNQKYTIAIKSDKIKLPWDQMKGKAVCATGVFIMYNGRPEIAIVDPKKISVQ